ncbi:MAG: DUF2213 domain-containing protein [Devosia sp.]|uniref:DUF2213 domain-containing protein n=1 Tax=Devosia sp. TaxID=1871048 RepID=UPI003392774C
MFVDTLIMDKTWETSDGFLGFSARFARTGIQMYRGDEIDPAGAHKDAAGNRRFQADTLYPVDRPADEVFAPRAMGSFLAKPITDDHPNAGVTADNWREKAKGAIGEVLRDGEYARMSGLITDKALIAKYRDGKRELSGGYGANIVIGDGINAKGEPYVAKQTQIDGNHVAVVDRGRAGSECAIKDAAHCDAVPQSFLDSLTQEKPVKNYVLDGLTVDLANPETAVATVDALKAQRDAAHVKVTTLETKAVTDAATIVAKDADIAKLTADLAAAKPTLQQLRDAARAFAVIEGKAKAAGVTVTDAMDEAAIMKAVVDKAMPGNTYAGDHVKIAFETLTKDLKVESADRLTTAISHQPLGDADKAANDARAAMIADMRGERAAA